MRASIILAGAAGLFVAACAQRNREYDAISGPPPPPAAVLAPALDSVPLDTKLARMQSLLDTALVNGVTGVGSARVVAAELLSDRLLEVPPPVAWLRAGYSTESHLRQIQEQADRVVAELRREDVDENVAVADTRALRDQIVRLRKELALGGTTPPAPIDSILATIPKNLGIAQGEVTD